ncbi:MAG: fibronectin type III domain-containing protein [Bacteroidia bacterium]|nr:fibronectin type III domain-containing protein [Bacteroidia bacterium]
MKNYIFTFKYLLFFLSLWAGVVLFPGSANAQTWYVDVNHPTTTPNGTQQHPFKDINSAVLAANAWDPLNNANTYKTIYVASGTYNTINDRNMIITVNKLRIVGDPGGPSRGPGANAPIIDGLNTQSFCFGINDQLKEVTIEGFYIRNFTASLPVHGLGTQGGINGVGIVAPFPFVNNPVTNVEKLTIKDIQFDNVVTAILLRQRPGNPNAFLYKNTVIQNNIINTGAGSQHGIYIENPDNTLIDNNEIRGNAAISAEIGIEVNIVAPTAGSTTLVAENVTISNNIIEYNKQTNIVISDGELGNGQYTAPGSGAKQIAGNSNLTFRNIHIINNQLVNNNTWGTNTNPLSQGRGKNIRIRRIVPNTNPSYNTTIENVIIEKNNIKYYITNGTVLLDEINSSTYIEDIAGNNQYKENIYYSEFNPSGLTVNGGAGGFHAINVDYRSVAGEWEVMRNNMTGHNINKDNDLGSAVYVGSVTVFNPVKVDIKENYITKFKHVLYLESTVSSSQVSNITLNRNHLAGNLVGVNNNSQLVAAPNTRTLVDASFNWWGDNNPITVANLVDGQHVVDGYCNPLNPPNTACLVSSSSSPSLGYTYVNCAGPQSSATYTVTTNNVTSTSTNLPPIPSVDYTPWLDVGTDMQPSVPGFQGNFSYLHVDRNSPQSPGLSRYECVGGGTTTCPPSGVPIVVERGTYGRVHEALQEVTDGGTIFIYQNGSYPYYNEGFTNTVTKNVFFASNGSPIIDKLRMQTSSPNQKLTLLCDLRIENLLDFQVGKIDLGSNSNLTVLCTNPCNVSSVISGGNTNSYVITNGTGMLRRDCLGGNNGFFGAVKFPVGTSNYYAPVTIQNTESNLLLAPDQFGVRVRDQVYDPPTSFSNPFNNNVGITWFINERCPNTISVCPYPVSTPNSFQNNNLSFTFEWNHSTNNENSAFNRHYSYIREYTSNGWVAVPGQGGQPNPASGSGPYTRSVTGYTGQVIDKAFAVFSDCPSQPIVPSTVARCEAGPLTITATFGPPVMAPPGSNTTPTHIYLYSVPNFGVPIAVHAGSPATFTTPSLSVGSIVTYYVASAIQGGCESVRVPVVASVSPNPGKPSAPDIIRCGPGIVTFTASMGTPPGSTIFLCTDISNPFATIVASDNTAPYLLTTPFLTTNTTFGLFVRTTGGNLACASDIDTVEAIIATPPANPMVMNVARCGAGAVTVTAMMGSPAGTEMRLYTQAVGGMPVLVDNNPPFELTASTTTTTTWFVEAFDGNTGCSSSSRTQVVVTIHNELIGPPFAVPTTISRCGPGVVTFTATMGTPAGNQFRVYDASSGGNVIVETSNNEISFIAPTSGTYYLAARNSLTTCESTTRFPINVIIDPGLGAPLVNNVSRCGAGAVTITATMGNPAGAEMRLYATATSTTPVVVDNSSPYLLTASTTTNVTWFVASANPNSGCESSRVPVSVTIHPLPGSPMVDNVFRCDNGSVNFTAMMGMPAGTEIRMYTQPSGGSAVSTASLAPYIFPTVSLTTTTSYYFTAFDGVTGCESNPRILAVANVNPLLGPPTAMPATRCAPGLVTVTAMMGSPAGDVMRLFSQAVGGTPVATDNMPPYELSASATTNVTWYVESYNSQTMCPSSSRTAVTVTINPGPAAPSVMPITRCGTGIGTFMVTMGTPAGNEVRLYTQMNGGVPIAVDNSAPFELVANVSTIGVTNFYVAAFDASQNCEGSRTLAPFTAIQAPDAPLALDVSRCGPGSVTISAAMGPVAGDVMRLYTTASGGTVVATSSTFPYLLVTPSVSTSTVFFVEAFSTLTNCASLTRTPVNVIINPIPGEPTIMPLTRCGAGVATFTIMMGNPAGNEVSLFATPTGGAPLAIDNVPPYNLTTPSVGATTTYYVAVANTSTGCVATRVPAVVNVVENPAAPMASNVVRCQAGNAVITAMMGTPAGTAIELYDQSSGGTVINMDGTPPYEVVTPIISATTTFYLESFHSGSGCRSLSRTPVVVTVNTTLPAAPSAVNVQRCGFGPVTINASVGIPGGDQIRLYTQAAGGSPITSGSGPSASLVTGNIGVTTTFYVSVYDQFTTCESPRTAVVASVLAAPGLPFAQNVERCGIGQVTLTAFMGVPAGDEIRLYDMPTGGAPIVVSSAAPYLLTTSFIATTTTFYLAAYNSNTNCESANRSQVVVTINPIPGAPTAQNQTICGANAPVIFAANMGNPAGDEIRMYNQPSGGTAIAVASTAPYLLQTPSLSASTVFYLEAANVITGCTSASRTPVLAILSPNPPPGTPTAMDISRCGSGVVTFSATMGTPMGNVIRLYNAMAGGSVVAQSSLAPYQLTTPVITTTTTFYMAAVNSSTGCESARVPLVATINLIPSAPSAMNVSRCQSGVVTITAMMGAEPGNEIRLFPSQTGGALLAVDNVAPFELTTPTVFASTNFFIESFNSLTGCASPRTQVTVSILAPPSAPSVSGIARCGSGVVTFTANNGSNPGTEMRLYVSSVGGSPIATDDTPPFELITPVLFATTTYFVESFNAQTNCASVRTQVVATVNTVPGTPIVSNVSRCGAGNITFTVNNSLPAGNQMRLYDSEIGGNWIATANSSPFELRVTNLNTTTTYYVASANTNTGCESARQAVVATIEPSIGAPTVSSVSRCGVGSVVLTVTGMPAEANQVRLFNSPTGGSPVSVANAFPFELGTPTLFTSTMYYVEAFNSTTGCTSPRVPVVITINSIPGIPSASTVARCGSGIVNITVAMGNPMGSEIRLYDTPVGGNPIGMDNTIPYEVTTPIVNATSVYYVSSFNSNTGCESSRAAVNVQINSVPGQPFAQDVSRCGAGNLIITAQMGTPSGNEMRLYLGQGDANPLSADNIFPYELNTGIVGTTTTFFIESVNTNTGCASTRRAVVATVNPGLGTPMVMDVNRCGPGSATITVMMGTPAGNSVRLYADPLSAQPIASRNSAPFEITTPLINTSTLFYVSSYNSTNGCESERVPVTVGISTLPSAPLVNNVSRCGSGVVIFSPMMSIIPGTEVRLYSTIMGGTVIAADALEPYELTTNNITTTTTFYIEVVNGVNGCVSPRTEVVGIVNALPSAPNAQGVTRCGAGSVTFTAFMGNVPGTEIRLYDASQGGNIIDADPAFPYELKTAIIPFTNTYFLEAVNANTGCVSATRTPVVATISSAPSAPLASNVMRCGAGSGTFTAFMGAIIGSEIRLYTAEAGGVALAVDNTPPYNLSTPFVNTTTTFYLASASGACEGIRTPIVLMIMEQPTAPVASNVSRCGTGSVTITGFMGGVAGTEMHLYNAPSGGTLVAIATNSPYLLTIPNLSTTTSYYVASVNNVSGGVCESQRTLVVATIHPSPSAPTANNLSRCGSGVVTITANFGIVPGTEIRLYNTAVGGFPLSVTTGAPAQITTETITTNTTYYLTSATANCESNRTAVVVRVNPQPSNPTAANVTRCGAGAVTFTVTMSGVMGSEVRLLDAPAGGNVLAVATNFPYLLTAANVTTTTVFYVSSVIGTCESSRIPVVATIGNQPSNPSVNNVTRCGTGVVTFSPVMGSIPGSEMRLYDSPSGGSAIDVANIAPFTLTTPSLTTNTIFYISSASGTCESARVPVRALVTGTPAAPNVSNVSRCGVGPVTLIASMGNPAGMEIRFYDAVGNLLATDNTAPYSFTTSSLSTNTTYLVGSGSGNCESPRVQVMVMVNSAPTVPSAANIGLCGAGAATFTGFMGAVAGTELRLYDAPTGGNLIAIATSSPYLLTVPFVATTSNYFLASAITDANGTCESSRFRVTATVGAAVSAPAVSNTSRCGSGVVNFTIFQPVGQNNEYRLYGDATSSAPIATATGNPAILSTPALLTTTTYFISAANGNCESNRIRVVAGVNIVPDAPQVSSVSRCGTGSVTLTLSYGTVAGNELRLYSTANATTPAFAGANSPFLISLANISTTTTYFASSVSTNESFTCESNRIPVVVNVNSRPSAPIISNITRCGSGSAVFTVAQGSISGSEVRVYTAFSGGTLVTSAPISGTSATITIPNVTSSTTYFFSMSNEGCEGSRSQASVAIVSPPFNPTVASVTRCSSGVVTLSVISPTATGFVLRAYDDAFGGNLVASSSVAPYTLTISNVTTTTTYYVSSTQNDCESARTAVVVNIIGSSAAPSVNNVIRCGSGTVTFTAVINETSGAEVRLYNSNVGGNVIAVAQASPYLLTVNNVATTTTYFVSSVVGNCESARIPVVATISGTPSAPIASNASACASGNSATFSVNMGRIPGNEIRIYDAPSGGNLLAVDDTAPYTVTVNVPGNEAIFFIAAAIGNCESSRIQVRATAGSQPSAPTAANVGRCNPGSVVISAQMGSNPGTEIRFYDAPSGGNLVGVVSAAPYFFTTPSINTTTTYYISSASGPCESARNSVVVSILPPPAQPAASASPVCGNATLTISISPSTTPPLEYRVYATSTGGAPIATAAGVSSTITVNNVGVNTLFLAAANGECESARTSIPVRTAPQPNLTASATSESCASTGSIVAQASGGSGNGYQYQLFLNDQLVSANATGVFSNLAAGNYVVRVQDQNGCVAQAAASVTGLGAPTITSVTAVTATSATVNWNPVAGAVSYTIQYRAANSNFVTISNISATVSSQVLTNLTPGTIYDVQLQVVCSNGRTSAFSPAQSFQTSSAPAGCPAPTNVTVNPISGTTAEVLWTNVSAATAYNIRYRELPNGSFLIFNNQASPSLLIESLSPGRTYEVQVQSICAGGVVSTFTSSPAFTTPGSPVPACEVPSNVQVNVNQNQATVTWNAVSGAQSYTLQYRVIPNGTFTEIANITGTSQNITGLSNGNYEVQVRANCREGSSAFSSARTFTISVSGGNGGSGSGICATPTDLRVIRTSANNATITWTPNASGASCYILSYGIAGTNPNNWPQFLIPHPGNILEATNLLPNNEYNVIIRTNCTLCSFRSGTITPPSAPVSFRTTAARVTDNSSSDETQVRVYPNPTQGGIIVDLVSTIEAQGVVRVIDITGKIVYEQNVDMSRGQVNLSVDLSAQPAGIYFLELRAPNIFKSLKVIRN